MERLALDKCILDYLVGLCNRSTQIMTSNKEEYKRARDVLDTGANVCRSQYVWGELMKLDLRDLERLGFQRYCADSTLTLIPLWVYPCIPDRTILVHINGDKKIKGLDNIDLDTRGGCIAYGVYIKY